MKKIIKNKKSQTALINSFIYDILFTIVLAIALFGVVKTVDSGMYYWRRFYAEDMGTLFTVLEGVSDDFYLTYVPHQQKTRFKSEPSYLELDISSGLVEIYSSDNPGHVTSKQFVTKLGSDFNLQTQLSNLFIKQGESNLDVSSDATCISYSISKKAFEETIIHTQSDVSTFSIKLKNDFEDLVALKYSFLYPPKSLTDNLGVCLFTKNVKNTDKTPDIFFNLDFKNSDENKIIISYPKEGNVALSATLACKLFNELNNNNDLAEEFEDLTIAIKHKSSDIDFKGNSDTGMVSIEFIFPSAKVSDDLSENIAESMFNVLKSILTFGSVEVECP